jgi:hypothetical protein
MPSRGDGREVGWMDEVRVTELEHFLARHAGEFFPLRGDVRDRTFDVCDPRDDRQRIEHARIPG